MINNDGDEASGPVTRRHRRRRRLLTALTAAAVLTAGMIMNAPTAAAEPECLHSSNDFDDDGIADPVIGAPGGRDASDGSVEVRISNHGAPYLVRIDGAPGFGSAVTRLTSYQNEGDDRLCSQLVVGSPDEAVDGVAGAGAVHVYAFDPGTRSFRERGRYTPGHNGVPGAPQAGARFGAAVASQQRVADEVDPQPQRLYVGAPGTDVNGVDGAGQVTSFTLGAQDAPRAENARRINYATPGVAGRPAVRAGFGGAISVDQGIVAVGASKQTAGGVSGAGAVLVLSDHDRFDPYSLSQASPDFPGTAETGDGFGWAVHVTPALDGAPPRLLIGAPNETIGAITGAGTVDVVPLSATTGRPAGRIVGWDQDSAGMAGTAEDFDRFGSSVTSTVVDGRLEYVVGTPFEAIGMVEAAGMVQTIGTGKGWSQATAGVPGTAEAGDRMGQTVSGSRDGILIGIPGENGGVGAVLSGLPGAATPALRLPSGDAPIAYGTALAT